MEEKDHAYINTTEDNANIAEFFYKMSTKEIEDFVKLRVTNNFLFSGKRNTSMWAWRAILKHMGLHHKMTHYQAKKKWENMKKRYKDLKYPPEGVPVFPETWPYFSLMEEAMEGRLQGSAPVLKALPSECDCSDFLPVSKPKKRKVPSMVLPSSSVVYGSEIEVSLGGDDEGKELAAAVERNNLMDLLVEEVEEERNETVNKKQHIMVMERERLVLQRERAVLDREIAVLERDRALLERERAMMERERAMVSKDRDAICRERLALEQERVKLERLHTTRNEEVTENSSEALDTSDTASLKEQFFDLFEKLIEKLEK